jgi:hypothetical protein
MSFVNGGADKPRGVRSVQASSGAGQLGRQHNVALVLSRFSSSTTITGSPARSAATAAEMVDSL